MCVHVCACMLSVLWLRQNHIVSKYGQQSADELSMSASIVSKGVCAVCAYAQMCAYVHVY